MRFTNASVSNENVAKNSRDIVENCEPVANLEIGIHQVATHQGDTNVTRNKVASMKPVSGGVDWACVQWTCIPSSCGKLYRRTKHNWDWLTASVLLAVQGHALVIIFGPTSSRRAARGRDQSSLILSHSTASQYIRTYRMCGNVCDMKFSQIASWTKLLRFYFRECLLRSLLSCQDGYRVYCFSAAAVITADWLEEVLNCFWHVCPKAPYVLEKCIDGKCSRNKCDVICEICENFISRTFPREGS